MAHAPAEPFSAELRMGRQRQQCLRDRVRAGRRAELVVDHAKLFALAPQPQHGFHEVVAVPAKYPAHPQHDVFWPQRRQLLFTGEFRGAVDRGRAGRILL
ncbi:conserved hypothetical protein, partial [Ricinus communis]